jgi:hypothetical protein
MFASRVRLLSDYAERYQTKINDLPRETGFWPALLSIFKNTERKQTILGYFGDANQESELVEAGFAPFCEIDQRRILFHKSPKEIQVAIINGEQVWNLADWGVDKEFVTRFIAECFFMVTRDDLKIDEQEHKVLNAIIGYIEPSHEEVEMARNMVYWTLVENVIEDDVVTEEESETMLKIREALAVDEKNVYHLHKQALIDRYLELKNETENETEIDLARFEKLKRMADRLGISEEIFD